MSQNVVNPYRYAGETTLYFIVKTGSQTITTTTETDDTLQVSTYTTPDYSSGAQVSAIAVGGEATFKLLSYGESAADSQGLQIGLTTLSDIGSVNMYSSTDVPISMMIHSSSSTEFRYDNTGGGAGSAVSNNDVFKFTYDTDTGAIEVFQNASSVFTGTSSQTGFDVYGWCTARTPKVQIMQIIQP